MVFLLIYTLASAFLILVVLPDLQGDEKSGAVQAIAAALTILPTMVLLVFAVNAESRATASEAESERLRRTAEAQAASMHALAIASEKQADVLAFQQQENLKIRLYVIETRRPWTFPGEARPRMIPVFSLVNMSAETLVVHSVSFLTTPGTQFNQIGMGKSPGLASPSDEDAMTHLVPGESRYLRLPQVSQLRNYTNTGPAMIPGFLLAVKCLYPGRGLTERRFKVTWAQWVDDAPVTVTPVAMDGRELAAQEADY